MIQIRSCCGFDELDACVRLEVETWGYDASEMIPRKAFVVAQRIGGQVIGAFDPSISGQKDRCGPESLVGFAMSLPGVKTGQGEPQAYLHSHMLAVREGYRNRGLGARLKWEQRREALSRGIRHMEWTFDPLESKNAYLNIHRLGAIVCRYEENFYGVSSSRLQGGLPTDRLFAEWRLDSPRVQARLEERPAAGLVSCERIQARIRVPASINAWKASDRDRERALAVQQDNRRKFQDAFARGLAVIGFTRDPEGNGVFELGELSAAEEPQSLKERKTL